MSPQHPLRNRYDPPESPFRDLLEDYPQFAFQAHLQNQDYSPRKQRRVSDQFRRVQNQFYGQIGNQILSGGRPTLRFNDFLSGDTGFDFDNFYESLSPFERGSSFTNRYAPRVRHLLRY